MPGHGVARVVQVGVGPRSLVQRVVIRPHRQVTRRTGRRRARRRVLVLRGSAGRGCGTRICRLRGSNAACGQSGHRHVSHEQDGTQDAHRRSCSLMNSTRVLPARRWLSGRCLPCAPVQLHVCLSIPFAVTGQPYFSPPQPLFNGDTCRPPGGQRRRSHSRSSSVVWGRRQTRLRSSPAAWGLRQA